MVRYWLNPNQVYLSGLKNSQFNLADARSLCLMECPVPSEDGLNWVCDYPEGDIRLTMDDWINRDYDYYEFLTPEMRNTSLQLQGPCYPVIFPSVNANFYGYAQVAAKVIGEVQALIIFPILPYVILAVFYMFWFSAALHLFSSGQILRNDCGGNCCSFDLKSNKINCDNCCGYRVHYTRNIGISILFHLFGCYWATQFIIACSSTVIAGSVASYYWARGEISIAITGKGFSKASAIATGLIMNNILRIGKVNVIGDVILYLGKLCVSLFCALFAFLMLDTHKYKSAHNKISSPLFPVLVTWGLGYIVATLFFAVVEMSIDTIILSFCQDAEEHQGTAQCAPPLLMETLDGQGEMQRLTHSS
ncbi:hypothetical protein B296_00024218 [Ensete ventricosum]|uniref:Choline transporter-like protein n=1 Tax=Ensete ventricosum TaxID=4639 RepID=A0A427AIH5_ENSVE|nr:hypothetical protein B296_00024218 [Ensete ventricosum]